MHRASAWAVTKLSLFCCVVPWALGCALGCASSETDPSIPEAEDASNDRIPSPNTPPNVRANDLVAQVDLNDPAEVASAFEQVSTSLFPLCRCIGTTVDEALPTASTCSGDSVQPRQLERDASRCSDERRAYRTYLETTLHALFTLNECLSTVDVRLNLGCAALPRDVLSRCTKVFEEEARDVNRRRDRLDCL